MSYEVNFNSRKFTASANLSQKSKITGNNSRTSVSAASNLGKTQKTFSLNSSIYSPQKVGGRTTTNTNYGRFNADNFRMQSNRSARIDLSGYQKETLSIPKNSGPGFLTSMFTTIVGSVLSGAAGGIGSQVSGAINSLGGSSASGSVSTASQMKTPGGREAITGLESASDSQQLGKAIGDAQNKLQNLEQANSGKSETGLKDEVDNAKKDVETQKGELTKNKQALTNCQNTISGCDAKIASLNSEIAALKASNIDGQNNEIIKAKEDELEKQQETKKDAENKATELKSEIAKNEENIANAETAVKTAEENLKTFQDNQADIDRLNKSIKKAEAQRTKMKAKEEKELNNLNKEISDIQDRMQKIADSIDTSDGMSKTEIRNNEKYQKLETELQQKLQRKQELDGIVNS